MRLPLWFLSPELITFPHIAPFNQAPARRASVCERSKRKTLHVHLPNPHGHQNQQGPQVRDACCGGFQCHGYPMPRLAWNPHCPNLLSWGWCYRGCQLVSALPFFGDANQNPHRLCPPEAACDLLFAEEHEVPSAGRMIAPTRNDQVRARLILS